MIGSRREGGSFPIVVFCVLVKRKMQITFLFIVQWLVLWDLVLGLVGVQWAFPKTVKEVLYSWRGAFVGKKRKKLWNSIPLFIFWTV